MPIRGGYANHVMIVTSGEMMSLYAAGNIAQAVRNFGKRGYAKLAGLIQNSRNVENEDELVRRAASEFETEILYAVPRNTAVQTAENQGKTVIEACPNSQMADCYQALADRVLEVIGE
jgi:nitrogenase iron protein NifH